MTALKSEKIFLHNPIKIFIVPSLIPAIARLPKIYLRHSKKRKFRIYPAKTALKSENFFLAHNLIEALIEALSNIAHPSNSKACESFVAGHSSAFFSN
jgi:hypothetical protein